MKHIVIISLVLLMGNLSSALNQSKKETNKNKIQKLVDSYYNQKFITQLSDRKYQHPDCRPTGKACVDVACEHMGQFDCDDLDELKEVNRACRGNYDGVCLQTMCDLVGQFDCNSIDEIRPLARACVGNYDVSCIKSTCARLGQFDCNSIDEVVEVAKFCSGEE